MPLSKSDIVGHKSKTHLITVPDYGEVLLREMSLGEVKEWQKQVQETIKAAEVAKTSSKAVESAIIESMLAYAISDAEGKRLFEKNELNLITANMPWTAAECIYAEAIRVNSLAAKTTDIRTEAESAKNSDATPT